MKRYLSTASVDVVACADQDVVAHVPEGLVLAALLPRGDVQEALVMKVGVADSLSGLPAGTTVCVTSAFHRLQIMAQHPHLVVLQSSSTLQKRLRRLHSGDYDACVSSAAGLRRWGFSEASGHLRLLDLSEVVPDFGQGAIGLICNADDEAVVRYLGKFDDSTTRTCIESETALAMRLELLGDAAAGGLARLRPDGQLHIQCTVAYRDHNIPATIQAERAGGVEESKDMARGIARELAGQTVQSLLTGVAVQQSEQGEDAPAELMTDPELWNDPDIEPVNEVLPPLPGTMERLQVEALDTTGVTEYVGRVCTVFPQGGGALVDVNCEAPARWHPEQAEGEITLLQLGAQVDIYCCQWQRRRVLAVSEQPPRLLQRGSGERLALDELSPGEGPFRAVVISCTSEGVLVDFSCEVAGRLVSSRSHSRGEELRVFCQEVDLARGTCTVATRRQQVARRISLTDLSAGSEVAYKGIVRRITGEGAFVDFHCEVMGYIRAMDIDIDALPEGLRVGHEVMVYVTSLDAPRRRVFLSMFRPRPDAGESATSPAWQRSLRG